MSDTQVGMAPLGNSDLVLADEQDDVRGMKVLDPNGYRVGEVDDLIVDEEERRARLLVVADGGFLGIDVHKRMVPVEAVAGVGEEVRLNDGPRSTPEYDPALVDQLDYSAVYGAYGIMPFWHVGYTQPPFLERG